MYLESPNEKGKFLSVDLLGNVSFEYKAQEGRAKTSIDQVWNVTEVSVEKMDGFLLVSNMYKMALNYDPERHGEKIHGKLFTGVTDGHTLWSFSDDEKNSLYEEGAIHPIYTIDSLGDRRYLWSLLGEVYVTPDEHIAESWTVVSLEGYDVGAQQKGEGSEIQGKDISLVIWLTLFVVLLYKLFLRRR